jgi:hypothetical protein
MLNSKVWLNNFVKRVPTSYIVKNIIYNIKGHVLFIIVIPLFSTSLQKKSKDVFNPHVKCDEHVVACKICVVSFLYFFPYNDVQSCL